MNSNSEKLRSSVINVLESEQSMSQMLESQSTASMFTCYYAQGALLAAKESYKSSTEELIKKEYVKKQAQSCHDISNNVMDSAAQTKQYVKQSEENAAVCASNMQIAATAIVKLAGGMGNVFSIINASDFDTEIYQQAENALNLINDTAYKAEQLSQLAMETSILLAEIPASDITAKSMNLNKAMNEVLKTCQINVNDALHRSIDDHSLLDLALSKTTLAEGDFRNNWAIKNSADSAYKLINSTLNLGLVAIPEEKELGINIAVEFTPILCPFDLDKKEPNPVKDYYLFIVKKDKNAVFTIEKAEMLVEKTKQYIRVKNINGKKRSIKCNIHCTKDHILDTDGDEILLGTEYVVFVMAIYNESYKKKLNAFDNFLSAPSNVFLLRYQLKAVDNKNITIISNQKLEFEIVENPSFEVEYRCMFLQKNKDLIEAFNHLNRNKKHGIGILFNLILAQQVSAANYIVAKKTSTAPLENIINGNNIDVVSKWEVSINEETTDVFGNKLMDATIYIPVILSFFAKNDGADKLFSNALSDFETSKCLYIRKRN